ncbi:MAG: hypothetical protein Q4E76_03485 [Tissierellia bacterium]|nr:hypothetical protein [Tissierellia bacterium]
MEGLHIEEIYYGSPTYHRLREARASELYRPWKEDLVEEYETLDPESRTFGLYRGEELMASLQFHREEQGVKIEDLLFLPMVSPQEHAKYLLQSLETYVRDQEGVEKISYTGRLSQRPLLEDLGYRVTSKHDGDRMRLLLDYEKERKHFSTQGLVPVMAIQAHPIYYVTQGGQGMEWLQGLIHAFPKEHFFLIDVADVSTATETLLREAAQGAKLVLLSGELAAHPQGKNWGSFSLLSALAQETQALSRAKGLLMLADDAIISSESMAIALNEVDPSLNLFTLSLPRAASVEGCYGIIQEHRDALEEFAFDSLLILNSKHSLHQEGIRTYLEDLLHRQITLLAPDRILQKTLRAQLVKGRLQRQTPRNGQLKIFSPDPEATRRALKEKAPTLAGVPIVRI